ncbi:MAG: FecR domain-containing protein [Rhizomicrobium sp.]
MSDRSNAQRLIEATRWQMQLDGETAETRADFEAWLDQPDNAAAWARLKQPWDLIGEHASDSKMVTYRQAALSDAKRTSARLNKKPTRWMAAVAAALVVSLVGTLAYQWITSPDDYATAFGERRTITLADGSKISLDSDSEVTVEYSKDARELRLLKGQARFDVAHDVERPFSVLARTQKVIATGTAFNIDITQPKVLVTLIEGHVVVLDETARPRAAADTARMPQLRPGIELRAGQQLAAAVDAPPSVSRADLHQATAWTAGQLVFDDQPLSEVVVRINRYATTPITIADASIGKLRLSGSFNTGDTVGFVDIVTHYLPVEAATAADGSIALIRK